jgi:hypothetical protein
MEISTGRTIGDLAVFLSIPESGNEGQSKGNAKSLGREGDGINECLSGREGAMQPGTVQRQKRRK